MGNTINNFPNIFVNGKGNNAGGGLRVALLRATRSAMDRSSGGKSSLTCKKYGVLLISRWLLLFLALTPLLASNLDFPLTLGETNCAKSPARWYIDNKGCRGGEKRRVCMWQGGGWKGVIVKALLNINQLIDPASRMLENLCWFSEYKAPHYNVIGRTPSASIAKGLRVSEYLSYPQRLNVKRKIVCAPLKSLLDDEGCV